MNQQDNRATATAPSINEFVRNEHERIDALDLTGRLTRECMRGGFIDYAALSIRLHKLVGELARSLNKHNGANAKAEPGGRIFWVKLGDALIPVEAVCEETTGFRPLVVAAWIGGCWVDPHHVSPLDITGWHADIARQLEAESDMRDADRAQERAEDRAAEQVAA